MGKDNGKIILVFILVGLILVTGITKWIFHTEDQEISIMEEDIDKKEKKEESQPAGEPWMSRSQIKDLEHTAEDNLELQVDGKDSGITFTGYEENPAAFSWMGQEEWQRMQNSLTGYLQNKGFTDVTEVQLHPDSIQTINEFERYVYLEVDHKNDYTDRLIIKAICDTYKDTMRFAFEIQYGS